MYAGCVPGMPSQYFLFLAPKMTSSLPMPVSQYCCQRCNTCASNRIVSDRSDRAACSDRAAAASQQRYYIARPRGAPRAAAPPPPPPRRRRARARAAAAAARRIARGQGQASTCGFSAPPRRSSAWCQRRAKEGVERAKLRQCPGPVGHARQRGLLHDACAAHCWRAAARHCVRDH
jgi:hypothetical protein